MFLSRSAQRAGLQLFRKVIIVNPLGAGFTIGPLLFLLALHYGASDTQMALLYASPFVMSFLAIFAPVWLRGMDTSRIFSRFWTIRAIISSGYILLPFISGTDLKTWLIILFCYGFTTSRALAITAWPSIARGFTNARELPKINADTHFFWHIGTLATGTASFLCLRWKEAFPTEEWAFISLFMLGFISNMWSASISRKFPETGTLTNTSIAGLIKANTHTWKEKHLREVGIIVILQVIIAVLLGYFMSYLKIVRHFESDSIFFLTLAGTSAAILGTKALNIIGADVSSRVLLFGPHAILAVVCFTWACIDQIAPEYIDTTVCLLYLLGSMQISLMVTTRSAVAAIRLPKETQYETSIVFQVCGAVGSVIGIAIGTGFEHFDLPFIEGHLYSDIFIIAGTLSAIATLITLTMHSERNLTLRQDFAALAPTSLWTLLRLQRLHASEIPSLQAKVHSMESIMFSQNQMSREFILSSLKTPELLPRFAAYRALNANPFPEAYDIVCTEAQFTDSPVRGEAITSLGFIGNTNAIPLLYQWLEEPGYRLQSVCIKSLLRLGENISDEELVRRYTNLPASRMRLDMLYGCLSMDRQTALLQFLSYELEIHSQPVWSRSLFICLAQSYNQRSSMTDILTCEMEEKGTGLAIVLAEINDINSSLPTDDLRTAVETEQWPVIHQYCPLGYNITAHDRTSAIGIMALWYIIQQD